MNGTAPTYYRLLFPLTPMFAVLAVNFVSVRSPDKRTAAESVDATPPKTMAAQSLQPLAPCCQKIPSRSAFAALPKYQVKFAAVSRGKSDYDAGSQMISVHCSFEDRCPEFPVVGISDMGLVARLQTDSGMLVEGGTGFCIINPAIRDFKSAPFTLLAKVPISAKSLRMVNGSVTVLRARDRAALVWREPFSAAIGTARKAGGFEFTLSKYEIVNGVATAEWTFKTPPESENQTGIWATRQLMGAMYCADKTVLNSESGKEKPTLIRRVFRVNKKAPMSLELSFYSVVKMENLPFELSGITLDGRPTAILQTSGEDQNF